MKIKRYFSIICIPVYVFLISACGNDKASEAEKNEIRALLNDTSTNPKLAKIEFLIIDENTEAELARTKKEKDQKVIWTFWDQGYAKISDFYRLNILSWRAVLGPDWKIRVLNNVPGDILNATAWLEPEKDLPKTYDTKAFWKDTQKIAHPAVFLSDMVRIGLLKKYGGIWMDASNILLSNPDKNCWEKLTNHSKMLCGYYNEVWSSKKFDFKSGFENWFIASNAENELITRWFNKFKGFWDVHSNPEEIRNAAVFKGLDFSGFPKDQRSGWDWAAYLTQHVAFLAAVSDDRGLELLKTQIIWKSDPQEARAYMEWPKIDNPFLDSYDPTFVTRLFSQQSIVKFTNLESKKVRGWSFDEIMDSKKNSLAPVYIAIILKGQRGVPW